MEGIPCEDEGKQRKGGHRYTVRGYEVKGEWSCCWRKEESKGKKSGRSGMKFLGSTQRGDFSVLATVSPLVSCLYKAGVNQHLAD